MGTIKSRYIELYGEEAWEKEAKRRNEHGKLNYIKNRDKWLEYNKGYRDSHKEELNDYSVQYRKTPIGRAKTLLHAYKQLDKKFNHGKCTLTEQWIIDNIFNSSCIYCGDSDWTHLGAERIDNSKPHTPDNCVCACGICNIERKDNYSVEEFKKYRQLHPRILKDQKSWEIVEQNGNKVLKKRAK